MINCRRNYSRTWGDTGIQLELSWILLTLYLLLSLLLLSTAGPPAGCPCRGKRLWRALGSLLRRTLEREEEKKGKKTGSAARPLTGRSAACKRQPATAL